MMGRGVHSLSDKDITDLRQAQTDISLACNKVQVLSTNDRFITSLNEPATADDGKVYIQPKTMCITHQFTDTSIGLGTRHDLGLWSMDSHGIIMEGVYCNLVPETVVTVSGTIGLPDMTNEKYRNTFSIADFNYLIQLMEVSGNRLLSFQDYSLSDYSVYKIIPAAYESLDDASDLEYPEAYDETILVLACYRTHSKMR